MRISDWSSDVCSSDLADRGKAGLQVAVAGQEQGVGERQLVAAPAGMELDTGRTQHRRQFAGNGAQRYLQLRQVGLAQARHRLADLGQLVVPGITLAVAHAPLEQAVALLPGAGVTRSDTNTTELQSLRSITYDVYSSK